MKHGNLSKNPSAQFKATIMDFHISYGQSAPLTAPSHSKNLIFGHLPFLRYFGQHKRSFPRFFGVFPDCHDNQVPFLVFFMFL